MSTLSIPNSFSDGGTIQASEHNANFNAVATFLNSTKINDDNIQAGGVGTASLASSAVTAAKIADTTITEAKLVAALAKKLLPLGCLADYAGTSAPSGWLLCYGQAVSRTTYADLFSAIGTTHGTGDGSTTFNLPDCRGRVTAGKDDMGGAAASRITNAAVGITGTTLGAAGGAQTHTLSAAESGVANHKHMTAIANLGSESPWNSGFTRVASDGNLHGFPVSWSAGDQMVTTDNPHGGAAAASSAHANVQPTIILNKIIFAGV